MSRHLVPFWVGAAVGIVASFAIAAGLIGAVLAVALVVLAGMLPPRFTALAGGLIGLGSVWLLLVLNHIRICSATTDFCGASNPYPWLAISLGLLSAGVVAGAITLSGRWRRGDRH